LPASAIVPYAKDNRLGSDNTIFNTQEPTHSFCVDHRYKTETPMPWLISSSLHAVSYYHLVRIDYDLVYSHQGKVQNMEFKPASKPSGEFNEFASSTLTLHPIGLY